VGWVDQALRDAEAYPRIAVNMSGISLGWVVPLVLGAAAGVGVAWGLRSYEVDQRAAQGRQAVVLSAR